MKGVFFFRGRSFEALRACWAGLELMVQKHVRWGQVCCLLQALLALAGKACLQELTTGLVDIRLDMGLRVDSSRHG